MDSPTLVARVLRAHDRGGMAAGSTGLDAVVLAARAGGYGVQEIAQAAGLSRQSVYEALDRTGYGRDDDAEGTRYLVRWPSPDLVAACRALECWHTPVTGWMAGELIEGAIRRERRGWIAEAGTGAAIRPLGRHSTKTDAVLAVLAELARRRAELREAVDGNRDAAILAPLIY